MKYTIYIDDKRTPAQIQDVALRMLGNLDINVLILNVRWVGLTINRMQLEVSQSTVPLVISALTYNGVEGFRLTDVEEGVLS